ncbi:protein kinase, ATP binding site-containing protein [Tanacetum coccineum]
MDESEAPSFPPPRPASYIDDHNENQLTKNQRPTLTQVRPTEPSYRDEADEDGGGVKAPSFQYVAEGRGKSEHDDRYETENEKPPSQGAVRPQNHGSSNQGRHWQPKTLSQKLRSQIVLIVISKRESSLAKRTVAIQHYQRDGYYFAEKKLKFLSGLHHDNIIPFIGYCNENDEMNLVTEYAVNRRLIDHLQDPDKRLSMTSPQRLNICIGAAKALNYLHSGLGEDCSVIHRNVNSHTNIA